MEKIKEMLPGQKVEGVFLLKKIKELNAGNGYYVTFSDESGNINGTVMKESCPLEGNGLLELLNKAVKSVAFVDFVDGNNFLKVLSIEKAEAEEARAACLVAGVTAEEVNNLKKEVCELISAVKNAAYQEILRFILKEKILERMAKMPASLSAEANFAGGLLYKSVMLTKMACAQAKALDAFPLQFQQGAGQVDYDLLITAGLLHGIGKLREYTEEAPFQKTEIGYYQGPRELTMQTILACGRELSNPLDTKEHAKLSSVIGSVYHEKGMGNILLEGTLLSNANLSFKELEMHISAMVEAKNKSDDGFVYSPKHGGYVLV